MTDDRSPDSTPDPDMPQEAEPEAPVETTEALDSPQAEAVAETQSAEVDDAGQSTPVPADSEAAAPEGASPEGAAAEGADGDEAPPERVSRRGKRSLSHGQAHIKASFNNTIISITDLAGNSIAWTSGGSVGFKGSRKSTPYAAQVAAEQAARKAGEVGIRKLDVVVRGSGSGRETAIRTLQTMGMEVTGVKDLTPTPHNGCRQKKRRRN